MDYSVYKLDFTTGVHFGNGMLNDSAYVFHADTLFSAMYIEAIKLGKEKAFYGQAKAGRLLLSDALPYVGEQYMLPKPLLHIEPADKGNSEEKKKFKKLAYLPAEQLKDYLAGKMDLEQDPMKDFGSFQQRTLAKARTDGDAQPFHVGIFHFQQGNGLYLILAHESKAEKHLAQELLESLSYTGIGGEKSSGLGRFALMTAGKSKGILASYLEKPSKVHLLLSTALPKDGELDHALDGASYLLGRRSGFIASYSYAGEFRRKRDLYLFMAGSCFKNRFSGDIYDVSEGGRHPVYRYAKPLFMGV